MPTQSVIARVPTLDTVAGQLPLFIIPALIL